MEPLLAWARPAAAVFTMRLCSVPPTSNPGWPAMGKALYRTANHGCFHGRQQQRRQLLRRDLVHARQPGTVYLTVSAGRDATALHKLADRLQAGGPIPLPCVLRPIALVSTSP